MKYCQLCTHKINMNDLTWESDLCYRTGNQIYIGYWVPCITIVKLSIVGISIHKSSIFCSNRAMFMISVNNAAKPVGRH